MLSPVAQVDFLTDQQRKMEAELELREKKINELARHKVGQGRGTRGRGGRQAAGFGGGGAAVRGVTGVTGYRAGMEQGAVGVR